MQSIFVSIIVNRGNLTGGSRKPFAKKNRTSMDFQFTEEKRVDYRRKGFSDGEIEQLAAFAFHDAVLPPRVWGYRRDDDDASDLDDYRGQADHRPIPLLKPILRKEMALEAIGLYRYALSYCDEHLYTDAEIILKAMQFDWLDAFYLASKDLKRDPAFLVQAASLQWCVLELIDPVHRSEEVVRAAFERSGFAYEYMSERDKCDPANILSAVSRDGRALQSVAEHLRTKEVVLAALENDLQCFHSVPKTLLHDRDVIFAALARRGAAYSVISSIDPAIIDLEIARKALSTDPSVYSFLPENIQNDYALALETIMSDAGVYSDMPVCMKETPWLALVAFSNNHYLSFTLPPSLRDGTLRRYLGSLRDAHRAFMVFMLGTMRRSKKDGGSCTRRRAESSQVLSKLNDNGPHFAVVFKRTMAEFAGVKIGNDFKIIVEAERLVKFL